MKKETQISEKYGMSMVMNRENAIESSLVCYRSAEQLEYYLSCFGSDSILGSVALALSSEQNSLCLSMKIYQYLNFPLYLFLILFSFFLLLPPFAHSFLPLVYPIVCSLQKSEQFILGSNT